MPFLTVLSATTQNCMHVNATALHEGDVVREEEGIVGEVETAVAVEQKRILAVHLQSFLIGDEEGSTCAVLRRVEHHLRLVVLRTERRLRRCPDLACSCRHIIAVDSGRSGV